MGNINKTIYFFLSITYIPPLRQLQNSFICSWHFKLSNAKNNP